MSSGPRKGRLLRLELARLCRDFDPARYSHGDLTKLIVARHSERCRGRAERRQRAREEIQKMLWEMYWEASRPLA